MALDFTVKDITHKVMAKFVPAFLPSAKKPYNLKAVFQPELDIHGIASKAAMYNITTAPRVIKEGLAAACKLICYLISDGYKIMIPICNMGIRFPGEYAGTETSLPEGISPEVLIQVSTALQNYIRERVQVEFGGIERRTGLITEAVDEHTGQINEVITLGKLLIVRGLALKVETDAAHTAQTGLFLNDGETPPIKVEVLAVNEPRTLIAMVPASLVVGKGYTLKIVTQSTITHGTGLLKEPREIYSGFKLTAQSA